MPVSRSKNQNRNKSRDRAESRNVMPTSEMETALPVHIEAERAILGAAILNPDSLMVAGQVLSREDFFFQSHQEVFGTLLEMSSLGDPIELSSLTSKLIEKHAIERVGGVGVI